MTPAQAAGILGVGADASWDDVRHAYRDRIRDHHPDVAGQSSAPHAARIIEAYRTLDRARLDAGTTPTATTHTPDPIPSTGRRVRWSAPEGFAPTVVRLDPDTLSLGAPADETWRWLIEAANDLGEITYLDRSGPILEVLCQFEGEPATSLMITTQGRADGTEAFCTVESIEARPAPPARAVVDLLELALRRRQETTRR